MKNSSRFILLLLFDSCFLIYPFHISRIPNISLLNEIRILLMWHIDPNSQAEYFFIHALFYVLNLATNYTFPYYKHCTTAECVPPLHDNLYGGSYSWRICLLITRNLSNKNYTHTYLFFSLRDWNPWGCTSFYSFNYLLSLLKIFSDKNNLADSFTHLLEPYNSISPSVKTSLLQRVYISISYLLLRKQLTTNTAWLYATS